MLSTRNVLLSFGVVADIFLESFGGLCQVMTDLIGFLRGRGLHENLLQKMEDDKIESDVLNIMDDDAMKTYIPKYGDRLAARAYCSTFKPAGQSIDEQTSLGDTMSKLRDRLMNRKRSKPQRTEEKATTSMSKEKNVRAQKPTRRVEIGWKDFDDVACCYRQVKQHSGGGIRHLEIERQLSSDSIMTAAKTLFFPEGISKKGKMEDYTFTLKDFLMEDVGSRTIGEIYDKTKVKLLRLYLCTQKITDDSKKKQEKPNGPSSSGASDVIDLEDTVDAVSDSDSLPDLFTSGISQDREAPMPSTSGTSVASSGTPTIVFNTRSSQRRHMRRGVNEHVNRSYLNLFSSDVLDTGMEGDSEDDIKCFSIESEKENSQNSLQEVLVNLQAQINFEQSNKFNISREDVMDGARRALHRKSFNPANIISVKFTDDFGNAEGAVDQGGPKRELLRLLMRKIQIMRIFEGPMNSRVLTLDSSALADELYKDVGIIIAMSIVHGGPTPKVFSPLLYDSITKDPKCLQASIEDIQDHELRTVIQKLQDTNVGDLSPCLDGIYQLLVVSGCFRVVRTPEDKEKLVKDLVNYIVFRRVSEGVLQLQEGLASLGVLPMMKRYPELFRELFVFNEEENITAGTVDAIFNDIHFSEEGNNKRCAEAKAISYWRDFLIDVEEAIDGSHSCEDDVKEQITLQDILVFTTGSDVIPPLGYDPMPSISFLHSSDIYPMANTCALSLSLPTSASSYESFKENMIFGILNSPGFGKA